MNELKSTLGEAGPVQREAYIELYPCSFYSSIHMSIKAKTPFS